MLIHRYSKTKQDEKKHFDVINCVCTIFHSSAYRILSTCDSVSECNSKGPERKLTKGKKREYVPLKTLCGKIRVREFFHLLAVYASCSGF